MVIQTYVFFCDQTHGRNNKLPIQIIIKSTPPPIGWGFTYCFTAVGVGLFVSIGVGVTPITKGPPAQIFLGGMFLFPRSLAFDFCCDLDIWGQGQAFRAFFVVMSFFTILPKYEWDFDQTWQEVSQTFGT